VKISNFRPEVVVFCRLITGVFLSIFGGLLSNNACAWTLQYSDLSDSYSNCSFQDNGDGTSTASVTFNYKDAKGHVGSFRFQRRGILIYSYDKNGKVIPNSAPAKTVSLNGVSTTSFTSIGSNYAMYYGRSGAWMVESAFTAKVSVVVNNSVIAAWPALSIRAGNYTTGNDVAEINGAAYVAWGVAGDSCRLLTSPETPPPLDINISVSAPDWDLGHLEYGESDTTFSRTDQQLCFSYRAGDVQGEKYIISASNANGVVNNRYRLQNLSDASQVVPYSLMLDSGSARIRLPGNTTALTLDASGRTCFVPTFTTEVDKTVKAGDYSDVLTFTVITKS